MRAPWRNSGGAPARAPPVRHAARRPRSGVQDARPLPAVPQSGMLYVGAEWRINPIRSSCAAFSRGRALDGPTPWRAPEIRRAGLVAHRARRFSRRPRGVESGDGPAFFPPPRKSRGRANGREAARAGKRAGRRRHHKCANPSAAGARRRGHAAGKIRRTGSAALIRAGAPRRRRLAARRSGERREQRQGSAGAGGAGAPAPRASAPGHAPAGARQASGGVTAFTVSSWVTPSRPVQRIDWPGLRPISAAPMGVRMEMRPASMSASPG